MKITQILKIIALIVIMMSCDEKKDIIAPNVDSYPMTNGTEWTYDRQVILQQYASESSDSIIDSDTINFIVSVRIEKDTLFNDTMNVKVFRAREKGNSWTSERYVFIDNEGLKTYAYSNAGDALVFAKKNSTTTLNYSFRSPYFLLGVPADLNNNWIFIEDKPTLDIKLPLTEISSWTYRHPKDTKSLQIDKEVIGFENLTLFGQQFACYKLNWYYLYNPVFNGIEITDWVSAEGLVKRLIVFDRVQLITQEDEINGTFQMIETLTLKELKIQNS